MFSRFLLSCVLILFLLNELDAQQNNSFSVKYIEKEQSISPGQIVNLAFMLNNNYPDEKNVNCIIKAPENWKIISNSQRIQLASSENKLILFTVQAGNSSPVGDYSLQMIVLNPELNDTLSKTDIILKIKEVEKISLILVESPQNVFAGQTFKANFLLQNLGNTTKKIYIETQNCDISGTSEIEVEAGKAVSFDVLRPTPGELPDAKKEYYTVRAVLAGAVKKSIYRSFTIFPTKFGKKDMYFRFPVSATATYVAANLQNTFEKGYQFEIFGNGSLDSTG